MAREFSAIFVFDLAGEGSEAAVFKDDEGKDDAAVAVQQNAGYVGSLVGKHEEVAIQGAAQYHQIACIGACPLANQNPCNSSDS